MSLRPASNHNRGWAELTGAIAVARAHDVHNRAVRRVTVGPYADRLVQLWIERHVRLVMPDEARIDEIQGQLSELLIADAA